MVTLVLYFTRVSLVGRDMQETGVRVSEKWAGIFPGCFSSLIKEPGKTSRQTLPKGGSCSKGQPLATCHPSLSPVHLRQAQGADLELVSPPHRGPADRSAGGTAGWRGRPSA